MDPTPGEYVASRPLEVVQIDHTQVDVIVVDDRAGKTIGRPWITLAVDVLTRMVTGFICPWKPLRGFRSACACCMQSTTRPPGSPRAVSKHPGLWPACPRRFTRTTGRTSAAEPSCVRVATRASGSSGGLPGKPHYGGHIERLDRHADGRRASAARHDFSHPGKRGQYHSRMRPA